MKTLFSGGLVFDGDNPPSSGRDVLVENGRIAAVRPAGDFSGFAEKKIDASGMTIMPGLIDCHVHLSFGAEPPRELVAVVRQSSSSELALRSLENAQATLRGGITAARDCGDREYNALVVRDAINAARHLGPTLRCAGRCICITGGQGSIFNGREVDSPDETVKAVRESIKAGVDLIKFTATGACTEPQADPSLAELSPEALAAGVGAAKAFGRPSACHAQGTLGLGNAVRAGVASIEHGFTMTEEIIAEMIERRTYLVPTLCRFATFLADETTLPFMVEKVQQWSNLHRKAVMDFHRAGGLVAMGTDMGAPGSPHGENCQELRRLVEIGVSPLDALRIATSRGADLLGFNDRGRVREGHWADLLVVRGDPSKDIEAVADRTRHAYVFKNGFDVLATLGPPKSGAAFPRFAYERAAA
ncbi:MAG TPA: amidohydrolase family protein [Candidatus Sulfotelmatobacter sp.]